MISNSILHFCSNGLSNLENITVKFFENPTDIASYISEIHYEFTKVALEYIGESFEELDEIIRNSGVRKNNWEIVRRDEKSLLTSLGEVCFKKTLFKNKRTSERCYLMDKVLDIDEHARMTEDAEARILEEAVQTSYRRGGEAASFLDSVSKQTTMNLIHSLEFPVASTPAEKKQVEYLYIEADEDHVALQEKGSAQAKLVYVHEGIEPETLNGKKHKLINPKFFSGLYEGKENSELWEEVYDYIESSYDLEKVKKIYLNADGGAWIRTGKSKISGVITVLDEYHVNKYLAKMTSHLFDSVDDGKELLKRAMRYGTRPEFQIATERIANVSDDEAVQNRVRMASKFILDNWTAARLRLQRREGVVGSSTEGHVSHVLASRMSSRPMGWSKHGADKMARLLAYKWNKGNMLDLIRSQKRDHIRPRREYRVFSSADLFKWESKHKLRDGKYYDKMQHSVTAGARKILAIREHLGQI